MSNIAAKIKALLAKSEDKSISPEEAMLFAEKARELLEKNGLSRSEVEFAAEPWVEHKIEEAGTKLYTISKIAMAVSKYAGVTAYLSGEWKYAKRSGKARAEYTPVFFGKEGDTAFAVWLCGMIGDTVDRAAKKYVKEHLYGYSKQSLKTALRNSFVKGMISQINALLYAAAKENAATGGGSGLVVLNKNQLAVDELSRRKDNLRERSPRATKVYTNAHGMGKAAAAGVSLNRPVNGGNGVLAIGN